MFKISRNAFLVMDICGNESIMNMEKFTKINISNFIFLTAAIVFKFLASAFELIYLLNIVKNDAIKIWATILNLIGFVFILIAFSLQLFKWINIIIRVNYFGNGRINTEIY